jgi:hypothetical protein
MANTIRKLIETNPECLDLPIHAILIDGARVETELNVDEICPPSDSDCDGECEKCNKKIKSVVVWTD